MSKVREDLAAVQRTLAIINGATIAAQDAPVVATVLNYLNHVQALLANNVASEKASEETKEKSTLDKFVDAANKRPKKRK
jgi:transcriptional regulator of NAD metabolism